VKPIVLLVTTERWYPTARFANALANAGFRVEAVCPSNHPIGKLSAAIRVHAYNGLLSGRSVTRAIRTANPDMVIPADDLATRHLHEIYRSAVKSQDHATSSLIERSLGSSESFATVRARSAFLELAQQEGIRTPKTQVVASSGDLLHWIKSTEFPVVLKADGTSGGEGVKVVKTLPEAERAFRKLHSPPLLARALKHAVANRDLTLLEPSLTRRHPIVNAQAFVDGREATSIMVCWEGAVLASLHFEVLQKVSATGHATVVRLIEHEEMLAAAVKITRRLKLSGMYGLDFMLEKRTGNAWLIEINPRTTQVGHLALGPGRDLPAALYAELADKPIEPTAPVTTNNTIALFPQEWKRDAASPFLSSAYHDVPWAEPELIKACMSQVRTFRSMPQPEPHPADLSSSTRVSVAASQSQG
jgi:carbamoylphosphate synthase large subunit